MGDYRHKNAVVSEQGAWVLQENEKALRTNLHEGFLPGSRVMAWAKAMVSVKNGVVIH